MTVIIKLTEFGQLPDKGLYKCKEIKDLLFGNLLITSLKTLT